MLLLSLSVSLSLSDQKFRSTEALSGTSSSVSVSTVTVGISYLTLGVSFSVRAVSRKFRSVTRYSFKQTMQGCHISHRSVPHVWDPIPRKIRCRSGVVTDILGGGVRVDSLNGKVFCRRSAWWRTWWRVAPGFVSGAVGSDRDRIKSYQIVSKVAHVFLGFFLSLLDHSRQHRHTVFELTKTSKRLTSLGEPCV